MSDPTKAQILSAANKCGISTSKYESSVYPLVSQLHAFANEFRAPLQDRIATLERELAEAKEREEEGDAVCKKLSDLLARVAIALKGEPPDMTLWSFHDLPELVATLAIENAILKEQKGDTNADV